ncbi:hypothetical protein [Paraburkholderia acidisoli]|jgi:hypothetical protein|uniref:Uncharacterized protein n=1 Tax=Paraburkholderia acidisoli TaxID=2571748 RepID=A0A7Z2GH02_9BURK|nr:hypothetical protein [Paraburkholderia acidisoli]QGZ61631.1 hypothetical protein FAZ98_07710 [Paraburkholderia acidisoli]
MERLARLLPFRQFGRLRHLRGIASCAAREVRATAAALNGSLFDQIDETPDLVATSAADLPPLPSAQPAFARVSLNSALNVEQPTRRAPVRVYHGPSRLILVGTVDAVCRAIDRCIAEQPSDLPAALAK